MPKKNFLTPLSLLVASLTASNTATANTPEKTESLKQIIQTSDQSALAIKLGEVTEYKVGADVFGFIMNKGDNGIIVADHYSHRSHSSHRSHYSSR